MTSAIQCIAIVTISVLIGVVLAVWIMCGRCDRRLRNNKKETRK